MKFVVFLREPKQGAGQGAGWNGGPAPSCRRLASPGIADDVVGHAFSHGFHEVSISVLEWTRALTFEAHTEIIPS